MTNRLVHALLWCVLSGVTAAAQPPTDTFGPWQAGTANWQGSSANLLDSAIAYVNDLDARADSDSDPVAGPSGNNSLADLENVLFIPASESGSNKHHWLLSHLELSGDSRHTREGVNGRLQLASQNLIWSQHALGVNFNNSASHREGEAHKRLAFRYAFPVGRQRITVRVENADFENSGTRNGIRYDTSGSHRTFELSGRRPLFDFHGVHINSLFSHSTRSSELYEESEWVEDSSRQLSTFGLQGAGHRELMADIDLNTSFTAVSGLEFQGADYGFETATEEERFHKLLLSASLSREVQSWRIGVDGRYQFAPDDLPESQHLLVASSSLVSGFNGQSLSAAEGGWLRLDARSPGWSVPYINGLRSHLRMSLLRGWVPYSRSQSDRYGQTSAGQLSLQFSGQAFSADFSVGQLLDSSSVAAVVPDSPDLSLSLTMGI
ncbi:ShlB/FhaC/HecB family hemolysin secretion/activation protein [Marinobacter profundi]|uniref:Haemolysin activator HlyB C-terminal domain-containing protein n=1 Tax=Marinobacter profundi TaxID=2666256 RepID=A0A2G1UP41_9GAMM|nr:ShlB/FhaC/HecB family hemolysin secretion/activation protein [Marinobacter profundi]PHQ16233.1 hypothetical protein CLH61_03875 [Marinobacter profundi]